MSASTIPSTLDERDARDVLLARAFEANDPDGRLIAPAELRAIERAAREVQDGLSANQVGGEDERVLAALVRRARGLRELVEARFGAVGTVLRIAGSGRLLLFAIVPIAFLAGAFADPLGPAKHVNLLSAMLFGLLAWNLLAYVVLLTFAITRPGAGLSLPRFLTALTGWCAAPERPWIRAATETEGALVAQALRTFLADWLRIGAPLHTARARAALHLGAFLFAAGAVAGLYVRGVALQYEATWESTFLDADAVHGLLATVLTPATWVTGIELPSAAELEADWRFDKSGNAAIWIHLYAVTLGLFVGLPRLALAAFSSSKAARLSRAMPFALDDATFLRWSAGERGSGVRVVVLPYSTGPTTSAASQALRGLLVDVLGARATIELTPPLDYGDEAPAERLAGDVRGIVLFNLAQSPEHEVHARFVEELAAGAANSAPSILVLLDESALRATLGAGDAAEERLAQRRKNWANVLRGSGVDTLPIDLTRPVPDETLARAREVLAS